MLLESEIYESLIPNKKYLPLFTVNKKAEHLSYLTFDIRNKNNL
jgi:hypothetical protein